MGSTLRRTCLLLATMLACSQPALAQAAPEAESSMIPLLKGPDSPGNPWFADYLAIDHWAYEKLQSGNIPYMMGQYNEPGFTSLTVYVDNNGYMLPQLSARRLLHQQMRGEQVPELDSFVNMRVQGIIPPAISRELELQHGELDRQYQQPVPHWLGRDPGGDALLLPAGYVVLRNSRLHEMLEELLASQGELRDGDLKRATEAYEYRMYDPAGQLLARDSSLPALFFGLAGLELPPGDGQMTEYGYFVFLDESGAPARIYDYDLSPVAGSWMDTARDRHPFTFIKPAELRMMFIAQSVNSQAPLE